MDEATVIQIAIQAMIVTAKVSAPILAVSLLIGFTVSLLQSVTQIQEVTLTFVPKLLGVAATLAVAGNWMLVELQTFTKSMFELVPRLIS
jgi:flagellar biosynthetic protein FliQ